MSDWVMSTGAVGSSVYCAQPPAGTGDRLLIGVSPSRNAVSDRLRSGVRLRSMSESFKALIAVVTWLSGRLTSCCSETFCNGWPASVGTAARMVAQSSGGVRGMSDRGIGGIDVELSNDVLSGDVRNGDVRNGDVRSGDVRSGDVVSSDVRRGDVRRGEVRSGDVRSGAAARDPSALALPSKSLPSDSTGVAAADVVSGALWPLVLFGVVEVSVTVVS